LTTAPNAEQRARWNGPSGSAWSEYAEHFERGYADFDAAYLTAVAARANDLVLDVGSGPGALALQIAATARHVVGVDVSAPLVDLARRRAQAADRDDAVFLVADAQVDPLPEGPFDVIVSHFGSMFFDDPLAAFTALHRVLRPRGRLVLLTWQGPERNPWQVEVLRALHPDQEAPIPPTDGPSPFGLSDAARVRVCWVPPASSTSTSRTSALRTGRGPTRTMPCASRPSTTRPCSTATTRPPGVVLSTGSARCSRPTTPTMGSGSTPRRGWCGPAGPESTGTATREAALLGRRSRGQRTASKMR
jgi:SAM-dependent methyltransferase